MSAAAPSAAAAHSVAVAAPPVSSRLLAAVGATPLVEIPSDSLPAGARLFAKLESVNPGGSIKDRPVARMLSSAIRSGRFTGGRRLLDSSSGNAGIAYAQIGAALGVGVSLVVPGNASRERLRRIEAHGAELILTDPMEGYDFAIATARRLAAEHPDRYWYCDQYSNDDNWRAHYETTGPEILAQVGEVVGKGDPRHDPERHRRALFFYRDVGVSVLDGSRGSCGRTSGARFRRGTGLRASGGLLCGEALAFRRLRGRIARRETSP